MKDIYSTHHVYAHYIPAQHQTFIPHSFIGEHQKKGLLFMRVAFLDTTRRPLQHRPMPVAGEEEGRRRRRIGFSLHFTIEDEAEEGRTSF